MWSFRLSIVFFLACNAPRGSEGTPPPDAPAPTLSAAPVAVPAPAPAAAPEPNPEPAPALPPVKLVTIGMHVAGGPFDEPTKEPFKKAVEPHFPDFLACWGKHVTGHPKQVDVGVDLLIEAAGGHPKISNPRTIGLDKADATTLMPCILSVFESVAFPKLDRGRTGVSYSLRFTP